jgi:hypothetical protein
MKQSLGLAHALLLLAGAPSPVLAQRLPTERPCLDCTATATLPELAPGSAEARELLLTFSPSPERPTSRATAPPQTLTPRECVQAALLAGAATAVIGVLLAYAINAVVDGYLPSDRDDTKLYLAAGGLGLGVGVGATAIYCAAQRYR